MCVRVFPVGGLRQYTVLGKARSALHSGDMNDKVKKPLPAVEKSDDRKRGPKPAAAPDSGDRAAEIGGRGGADPTRFGDWEKDGRCVDF